MYITTTPYLPCNKNQKELYDFYYTALTTGYKLLIHYVAKKSSRSLWIVSGILRIVHNYVAAVG